jgi:hypothetical protein
MADWGFGVAEWGYGMAEWTARQPVNWQAWVRILDLAPSPRKKYPAQGETQLQEVHNPARMNTVFLYCKASM